MPKERRTPILMLVRRVYRFDTQQEMAALVARIDADVALKQAFGQTFYRLSLTDEKGWYCIIFHLASLESKYQTALVGYATQCGGVEVADQKVRDALSNYALVRYLGNGGEHVRWDDPVPKPS